MGAIVIVNGPTSSGSTSAWGDGFVLRGTPLPAGNITAIGLDAPAPGNHTVKVARWDGGSQWTVVSNTPMAHPGGGWADQPVAFTVPDDGSEYHMGAYINGTVARSVDAPRGVASGVDFTGTVSLYTDNLGMPVMRATYDGEPPPDPEPDPDPDPPSESTYLYLFAGQSNGNALAGGPAGQAFLARMAQLVPGVTHQIVNACVNSSRIADDGEGKQHWQPTGGLGDLCDNAIALIQAQSGTLAGVHWYQGESQSRAGKEWSILKYPEYLRTTFDYIAPGVPKFIVELHAQPDATFPTWTHMQWMQRTMCQPGFAGVGATLVSGADQSASYDGGLHLTDAALTVIAERLADAQAAAIWPR